MEQLANDYSTTLASSYTAGAGSISVATATGAPTNGTFSLTILDATTKAVKLIYRVASVSGTTFSGAAEGTDANCSTGDIVVGTMLTVAALNQIKVDAFIQPLVAPIPSQFTQRNFNVGSGVTTTQTDNGVSVSSAPSITVVQDDPSATFNIAGIDKSKIASTFTVTMGFTAATLGQNLGGLWLNDGGSPPNSIYFGIQGGSNGLRASEFSDYVTYAGDRISPSQFVWWGPLIWVRIKETASARNYYVSGDGINWLQILTESNTALFTTSRYGMMMQNRGSGSGNIMVTMYSFQETTP
jgi:hypothetical protein